MHPARFSSCLSSRLAHRRHSETAPFTKRVLSQPASGSMAMSRVPLISRGYPVWAWPSPRPSWRTGTQTVRSLASLDRVPGVGPGLLRALGPHLTFSRAESARINRIAPSAGVGTTFASPHSADAVAGQIGPREGSLNVNRATAVELEGLPGIGPALAARIVADREARGSFATISAMDRVPGIGPALLSRLGRLVTAP
jgi:competence ComEA-like helix-hairpin-helix protein